MNIHEYQAKQLFERFGVATPKGIAASTLILGRENERSFFFPASSAVCCNARTDRVSSSIWA